MGRAFLRDERGSVIVPAAAMMLLLLGFGAFTADISTFQYQRRKLQSAADMAAMAAAASGSDPLSAAYTSLRDNGYDVNVLQALVLGHYEADPQRSPDTRFQRDAMPINAARVDLASESDIVLGRVFSLVGLRRAGQSGDSSGFNAVVGAAGRVIIRAESTAANADFATLSLGSRLASLDGGILNDLTTALVGGRVGLSVLDYRALADAQISGFDLLRDLAQRSGLSLTSYNEVMSASLPLDTILAAASAHVMGGGVVSSLLSSLAQSADRTRHFNLASLFDAGPYGASMLARLPPIKLRLNALNLLAALQRRMPISLGAGLSVGSATLVSASLTIGQPPQSWAVRIAAEGSSVSTAQARVDLVLQMALPGLDPLLRIPLSVDVAAAQARVDRMRCAAQGAVGLDLTVQPSVARLWIGDMPAAGSTLSSVTAARVAYVPGLASIRLRAGAEATNLQARAVTLTALDIAAGTHRAVSTQDTLLSLLQSALSSLQVDIAIGPLALPAPALDTLLRQTLLGVAAPLNDALDGLFGALGLRIGEAEVWATDMRCAGAVLVR